MVTAVVRLLGGSVVAMLLMVVDEGDDDGGCVDGDWWPVAAVKIDSRNR